MTADCEGSEVDKIGVWERNKHVSNLIKTFELGMASVRFWIPGRAAKYVKLDTADLVRNIARSAWGRVSGESTEHVHCIASRQTWWLCWRWAISAEPLCVASKVSFRWHSTSKTAIPDCRVSIVHCFSQIELHNERLHCSFMLCVSEVCGHLGAIHVDLAYAGCSRINWRCGLL